MYNLLLLKVCLFFLVLYKTGLQKDVKNTFHNIESKNRVPDVRDQYSAPCLVDRRGRSSSELPNGSPDEIVLKRIMSSDFKWMVSYKNALDCTALKYDSASNFALNRMASDPDVGNNLRIPIIFLPYPHPL